MDLADALDGFGTDERNVAGEDEKIFRDNGSGEREESLDHLESVSGSTLLCLQDELDAGGFHCGPDSVSLMTDDAVDSAGIHDLPSGSDDVKHKGAASDLVEDLGAFALEPRAFAGGHDRDGEICRFHVR